MIESFCNTAGNDDVLLYNSRIKALIKLLLSEEQTDFEDLKDLGPTDEEALVFIDG